MLGKKGESLEKLGQGCLERIGISEVRIRENLGF